MRPHEPECQHYVEEAESIRTGACIFCGIARAAYTRGREDAAKAVIESVRQAWGENDFDHYLNGDAFPLIAAARGDGEQA